MMRCRWGVLAFVLALAGCGGPQIVAVQGTGAQPAIEQHSLQIVFSGKTSTGWTKHERSAVQASRFATGESVARELAGAMLAQLKASALIQ